ncbi:hypothetical protein BGZ60DRAFT_523524 [Tricladium varicosporioides]|nr:hypothetical protein BGZ60DRAFT_523524 [Hymenoscyphus varicosporioides]
MSSGARASPENVADLAVSMPLETFATSENTAELAEPQSPPRSMQSSRVRNRGEGRTGRASEENEGGSSGSTHLSPPGLEDHIEAVPGGTEPSHPIAFWRNLIARTPLQQREQAKREYNARQGYDKFKYNHVHDLPEGFPQLASWLNSNNNWNIYRGFGSLSARVLVDLQIELTQLEQKILDLDKANEVHEQLNPGPNGNEGAPRDNGEQKQNVQNAKAKLLEYYDFLLKYCQVYALDRPTDRHYLAFYNWMWGEKPLCQEKSDFMFYINDFVSVYKHTEKSNRLANFMERFLDKCSLLRRIFQSDRELDKSKSKFVLHYSTARLNLFAKFATVFISVGMLLIPVMLLFLVKMSRAAEAWLVFGFVMAFSMIVALVADAKTHEALIGTAAYTAVLVTFLGNLR